MVPSSTTLNSTALIRAGIKWFLNKFLDQTGMGILCVFSCLLVWSIVAGKLASATDYRDSKQDDLLSVVYPGTNPLGWQVWRQLQQHVDSRYDQKLNYSKLRLSKPLLWAWVLLGVEGIYDLWPWSSLLNDCDEGQICIIKFLLNLCQQEQKTWSECVMTKA